MSQVRPDDEDGRVTWLGSLGTGKNNRIIEKTLCFLNCYQRSVHLYVTHFILIEV